MKNFVLAVVAVAVVATASVGSAAENDLVSSIWSMSGATLLEKFSPTQSPSQKQFQAPEKSVFQAPSKMELQAPSKSVALIRAKQCSLIPGRAIRIARRADRLDRQLNALEARGVARRTLLEVTSAEQAAGRTVMEAGSCSSCNSGNGRATTIGPDTQLTSLTTRELREGGSIGQQVRTVNEPGVCGGGGNGSGRRGIFRR